jgi:hexosaminidase
MNRVVDAVPLESAAGRRFAELVDKFIAASCLDSEAGARLRTQFTAWRDNDARLKPLVERSFLVREVVERSRDLSALGTMGLAALEAVAKRQPAPGSWKTQQLATIEQLKKQKAQLLLIPVPAVQKLVEAAAAGGSCVGAK